MITRLRTQSKFVIVIVALVLLQFPWYLGVSLYANAMQVKTTATVVATENTGRCSVLSLRANYRICNAPVYEYRGSANKVLRSTDQYITSYTTGSISSHTFNRKPGAKVTAYFTKDKPSEVLFMASFLAYTAWFIPLYLAIVTSIVYVMLSICRYVYDLVQSP